MVRISELDTDGLGERDRAVLGDLLTSAGGPAAPVAGAPAAQGDEMGYEISVEGDGEPVVVHYSESSLPDGARALMAWVAEQPATRSRIAPPARG